jgi:UV excision repair protein RAD23
MKIQVKTLKSDLFTIECGEEDQVGKKCPVLFRLHGFFASHVVPRCPVRTCVDVDLACAPLRRCGPFLQVGSLKSKIEAARPELSVDRQKLIHAGKVLKDDQTVSSLGIKESDFIVCMVTKETAKPKIAADPVPAAAPSSAVPTTPAATAAPSAAPGAPAAAAAAAPAAAAAAVNSQFVTQEAVDSLTAMGFPEAETRAALAAATGNPDLAYEFLLTGIPEQAQARAAPAAASPATALAGPAGGAADIESLRQHPQFNTLKQLIQSNPAALPQVLQLIGQQSPQLLEAIHANNDAFLAMMNEPITAAPAPAAAAPSSAAARDMGNPAQMIQALATMPAEQRAAFAQSLGMTPEQLQGMMQMMAMMPPGQLEQAMAGMGGMGGMGGPPPGANVIRLTEEEMAAVNRLVALGFDQQQAAQAYLACDKNEALAANFLLEGGFMDDDDGGDDMYN